MADVIEIYNKFYASCPICGSINWNLIVNGLGHSWDIIEGTECAECGFIMTWVVVENR